MADPKRTTATLTNVGAGPRSFFLADGTQHILAPGESAVDVEVLQAELDGLGDDFKSGPVDEDAAAAARDDTGGDFQSRGDYPPLDGLNRDQLIEVARREGYTFATDPDASASEQDLRDAIETARAAGGTGAEANAEADQLAADNTVAELRKIAADEGITIPPEVTTKPLIALTIAQAREAKAADAA